MTNHDQRQKAWSSYRLETMSEEYQNHMRKQFGDNAHLAFQVSQAILLIYGEGIKAEEEGTSASEFSLRATKLAMQWAKSCPPEQLRAALGCAISQAASVTTQLERQEKHLEVLEVFCSLLKKPTSHDP